MECERAEGTQMKLSAQPWLQHLPWFSILLEIFLYFVCLWNKTINTERAHWAWTFHRARGGLREYKCLNRLNWTPRWLYHVSSLVQSPRHVQITNTSLNIAGNCPEWSRWVCWRFCYASKSERNGLKHSRQNEHIARDMVDNEHIEYIPA